MPIASKESRDLLLSTLQSLKGLCQAVSRESKHLQKGCVWKGKTYTIIWRLEFDVDFPQFELWCLVMPEEASPESKPELESGAASSEESLSGICPKHPTGNSDLLKAELREIEDRILSGLCHLTANEDWPATIPPEWLEP